MKLPVTDSSYLHLENYFEWFPISDLYSNAYYPWRTNPLLGLLSFNTPALYILLLVLIASGSAAWISKTIKESTTDGLLVSLATFTASICLFGFNIPLLSFLASLYILTASLLFISRGKSSRLIKVVVTASCALFVLYTTNQLSIISLLASLFTARCLGISVDRKILLFFIGCFTIPILAPPSFNFPDYPAEALLVPGYGTPFGIDPLIGYKLSRPVIDKEFTQGILMLPALALLAVSLYLYSRLRTTITLGALITCISLLLDTSLVPESVRLISPFQSIPRIVPGYSFLPFASFIVHIALFLLGIGCARLKNSRKTCTVLFVVFAACSFANLPSNSEFGDIISPARTFKVKQALIESPSLYILRHENDSSFEKPAGTIKSLAALNATLTSSHNQEALSTLLDKDPKTRWSTKLALQSGDEWIQVQLPSPMTLSGIDISVPHFSSDFPRGIEITYGNLKDGRCDPVATIFKSPRWLGSVLFTPEGYPYYSSESMVRVPFKPITAQCLKISQTGRADSYEWSIEGISLLIS